MLKKSYHLVLGSGGARGMAHIGVIEELEKRNIEIASISGCSMGSVVGAIYLAGQLEAFKKWMIELDYFDYFTLVDFTFSGKGFMKGEKLFKKLEQFITKVNIEDLEIKYQAVATDMQNGNEYIFTKGALIDAVRASISLPTVFLPKKIDNFNLLDGGIVNPLPMNLVKKSVTTGICAVNLNARKKYEPPAEFIKKKEENKIQLFNNSLNSFFKTNKKVEDEIGFFKLLNDSYDLTQDTLTRKNLEVHKPEILVEIPRTSCGTMEFTRSQELIEYGRKAFNEAVTKLEK